MDALTGLLVPILILIVVALIIWWIAERFSPDPLVTKIVQVILFAVVLIVIVTKLFPLLKLG